MIIVTGRNVASYKENVEIFYRMKTNGVVFVMLKQIISWFVECLGSVSEGGRDSFAITCGNMHGYFGGAVLALIVFSNIALAGESKIRLEGHPDAIPGEYIVVFRDDVKSINSVAERVRGLASGYGARIDHEYAGALRGFSARMNRAAAKALAADPSVAYVEQNVLVRGEGTGIQVSPSWGLDRIDQRNRSYDNKYKYLNTAPDVRIYIVDTGIAVGHSDFEGRASWGTNVINDGLNYDCHGHGTHVAGIAASKTYGVAKDAQLVAVKVSSCSNTSSIAAIIAGVEWVQLHAVKPAVANISITTPKSSALDFAVSSLITSGVPVTVSAGNQGVDACSRSPSGQFTSIIMVGMTDASDNRHPNSNYGPCVTLYAPGKAILSTWSTGGAVNLTGTSMSAPHAAGVAAQLLSQDPTLTPSQVRSKLVADSTKNALGNLAASDFNRLLYVSVPKPVIESISCSGVQLWGISCSINTSGAVDSIEWYREGIYLDSLDGKYSVSRVKCASTSVEIRVKVGNVSGSSSETTTAWCRSPSGPLPLQST